LSTSRPEYDLVLVVTTFRRVMVYLSLVKAMSARHPIAVYVLPGSEHDERKTGETNKLFLDRCRQLGADVVEGRRLRGRIAIIPQWPYTREQREVLRRDVEAGENHVLIGVATGMLHMEHLDGVPVHRLLVVDLDLFRFRLENRPGEAAMLRDWPAVVEVGLPFTRHPVMDDLGIDYLLANPTPLSLPTLRARIAYLRTVRRLLAHLPASDRVVLKPHNAGEAHDYIVLPRALALARGLGVRPLRALLRGVLRLVLALSGSAEAKGPRRALLEVLVALEYQAVLERVTPLRELTPYHNFSLEVLLPQVRKGVITGRSNTLWHALYCRLPAYNCVDDTDLPEDADKMNFLTMRYLGIPFCAGEPRFDTALFARVRDEVRRRDLVAFYEAHLARAADGTNG
jgi:hypothetical protein